MTIKDPNVTVYNFDNNKDDENKNIIQNYSVLDNSKIKNDIEENDK